MTKIGTLYLLVVIFFSFALPRSRISVWIAVFVPLAVVSFAIFVCIRRRSVRFREFFTEAITLVSLKMKSGRSFRQAYSEVTAESSPRFRAKLSEIGSVVVFSQQKRAYLSDRFIADVIDELIRIDQQPHAASRRLTQFRERLRIEDDFRRKSGQVLARLRAQSLLMTVLYLALANFTIWKFGWSRNARLMGVSATLFIVGTIWMWLGGRKIKWKA